MPALHTEYGCLSVMTSSFAHLSAHEGGCMPPCTPTLPFFFSYQSLPTAITLPASVHHGVHTCSFQPSSGLTFPSRQMVPSVPIDAAVPGIVAQSSETVDLCTQKISASIELRKSLAGCLLIVQCALKYHWKSCSNFQIKAD